jgi:DNA-binding SARP family transcriptional activator
MRNAQSAADGDVVFQGHSLVRVLGEVALQQGPELVSVPGRLLRRLLLRLLLAEGRPVSASVLSEDVWGDMVPNETIRVQLSRLRRVITPLNMAIVGVGSGWVLSCDPEQIDSVLFANHVERALKSTAPDEVLASCAQAMSYVRGRMLDDVADEQWARVEAENLESKRTAVMQRWAETLVLTGRTDESISVLRQLTSEHPYDERAIAWLAISIGLRGDRSEGLALLNRFRRALSDDLGVRPGPIFNAAESAFLDELTPLRTALSLTYPLQNVPWESAPERTSVNRTRPNRLVGRAASWQRLTLDRPAVAVSVLSGEEGIGKSALARQLAEVHGENRHLILYGQCTENSGVAFEPLLESVSAINKGEFQRIANRVLRGAPWTNRELQPDSPLSFDTVAEHVGAQFGELLELLREKTSVTLIIEDLHWASGSTLRALRSFISQLNRSVKLHPGEVVADLHVVLTHRTIRTSQTDLLEFVSAVLRFEGAVQIFLEPLDELAIVDLVSGLGLSMSSESVGKIWRHSSGIPLFVGELIRELVRDDFTIDPEKIDSVLPARIETLTRERINRLSENSWGLLSLVSCAGGFLLHAFARQVGLFATDRLYFDAVDECLAADLLADDSRSDGLVFRHSYFERVVRGLTSKLRQQQIHYSLALAMSGDDSFTIEEANHLWLAGSFSPRESLLEACLKAATYSGLAGATDIAESQSLRLLETLRESDKQWAKVHFTVGFVASLAKDIQRAKLHAAMSIRRALSDGDFETALNAVELHGAYGKDGSADLESLSLLTGVGEAVPADSRYGHIVSMVRHEHEAMWLGDCTISESSAEASFDALEGDGDNFKVGSVAYLISMAQLADPDLAKRERRIGSLQRTVPRSGIAADEGRAIRLQTLVAFQQGDRRKIERLIDAAEMHAKTPSVWYLANDASRWKACLAMADGRWADASSWIDESDERSYGVEVYLDAGKAQRALLAAMLGQLDGTEPELSAMRANVIIRASIEGLIGMCALYRGDHAGALRQLHILVENTGERYRHRNHLCDLAFVASLVDALDAREIAIQMTDRFEPYAGQMAVTAAAEFAMGAFDRYRGIMASLRGDHKVAERMFLQADAFEAGWPVLQIATALSRARARLRAGDTRRASEIAIDGGLFAEACSLDPLRRAFAEVKESAARVSNEYE